VADFKTKVLTRALNYLFLDLYPTYHPTGGVQVLQKAWNLLSGDVKASLQSAESNLDALKTVDLGPKRPFSVGECAPHPALLASTVFGVRVAAVIQHKIVLVEPDFAQSAKLEVQQRPWPGRGGQQRSRRKWSGGDTRRASRSLKWDPSSRFSPASKGN
jgi:hypothetical protein